MPYEYFATVDRVIDGDPISVTLDLGFSICLGPKTLRLEGVNTPEMRDRDPELRARAQAATAYIKERLLPSDPTKAPAVKIQTLKPSADDKYGRLLGRVLYLPPAQKPKRRKKVKTTAQPVWIDLNEELLLKGFAKAYDGTGQKPV